MVTASRRATARIIVTTPATPAMTMRAMTAMPVQWMSGSGMKVKKASDSVSCGPWAEYMKTAKNSAMTIAMTVPANGLVYRIRENPVLS